MNVLNEITSFYELYEKQLFSYNQEYINKLYEIINNAQNTLDENYWLTKCNNILIECKNIFSNMNYDYPENAIIYSKIINVLLKKYDATKMENKYVIKKLNLYVQLFDYLIFLNNNEYVFFDKDKYDLTITTYNLFMNFNDNIINSHIEWYSNYVVCFYSKSNKYTNICIYKIDDFYGYKLFISLQKNNIFNTINIKVCDVFINSSDDFYNKLNFMENLKFSESSVNKNSLQFINIKEIGNFFVLKNKNINIEFSESKYICSDKMLEFVKDFLHN